MPGKLRDRLSYANVTATLALFAALGGGAWAAVKIGPQDIAKDAVRSRAIKDHQVRERDVKDIDFLTHSEERYVSARLALGETHTIAENGPVSLEASCDQFVDEHGQTQDRVRVLGASTEVGSYVTGVLTGPGAGEPGFSLGPNTPADQRVIAEVATADGTAPYASRVGEGLVNGDPGEGGVVVSASGTFVRAVAEDAILALNEFEAKCLVYMPVRAGQIKQGG